MLKQVTSGSKEMYELMADFEKLTKTSKVYLTDYRRYKGDVKGVWYENGTTNDCFIMFLSGFNLGIAKANLEAQ